MNQNIIIFIYFNIFFYTIKVLGVSAMEPRAGQKIQTQYTSLSPPTNLDVQPSTLNTTALPPLPDLESRIICNGLVGLWNHDFNMQLSGDPELAVGLYIRTSCGCTELNAHLLKDGVINYNYSYRINTVKRRYELNNLLFATPIYEDDGGAWCQYWDVGDGSMLILDDDNGSQTAIGYIKIVSHDETARLNATNPTNDLIFHYEALLKTWGQAFNQLLNISREAYGFSETVIGRRSKGCYIMIRLNEPISFFMTTDLYRFMDGAIWGVPYEEWPFRIAYHDSSTNFFKHLRYDTDTGLFKRASPLTEAYLRPVDGGRSTRHNFKGDRFEGHEIFLDKSPCAVDLDGDHMDISLRINEGVADFLILAGQAMLMTDYVAQRMHS